MGPATICEENHKLATVRLFSTLVLQIQISVQKKKVHFKNVFYVFFCCCQNCIFLFIVFLFYFNLLDEFKIGGIKGKLPEQLYSNMQMVCRSRYHHIWMSSIGNKKKAALTAIVCTLF